MPHFLIFLILNRQVATAVLNFMNEMSWTRAKLVVEPDGHPEVGRKFCYLTGSTIRSIATELSKSITDWNFGPDANTSVSSLQDELK